jgi:hypothetical protein
VSEKDCPTEPDTLRYYQIQAQIKGFKNKLETIYAINFTEAWDKAEKSFNASDNAADNVWLFRIEDTESGEVRIDLGFDESWEEQ